MKGLIRSESQEAILQRRMVVRKVDDFDPCTDPPLKHPPHTHTMTVVVSAYEDTC